MNYKTIESKIPFSQAYPFNTYHELREYVISYDVDGAYILSNYSPFQYTFDN
jgi:hypothetical protein